MCKNKSYLKHQNIFPISLGVPKRLLHSQTYLEVIRGRLHDPCEQENLKAFVKYAHGITLKKDMCLNGQLVLTKKKTKSSSCETDSNADVSGISIFVVFF